VTAQATPPTALFATESGLRLGMRGRAHLSRFQGGETFARLLRLLACAKAAYREVDWACTLGAEADLRGLPR